MVLKPRAEAPQWDGYGNGDQSAKCLSHPPTREHDPWFSSEELSAAAICNGSKDGRMCPLRDKCLTWALINNEQYGVWGGMLPHDRRAMRLAKRVNPYLEWLWHPPTPIDELLTDDELQALDSDLPRILHYVDDWPIL